MLIEAKKKSKAVLNFIVAPPDTIRSSGESPIVQAMITAALKNRVIERITFSPSKIGVSLEFAMIYAR